MKRNANVFLEENCHLPTLFRDMVLVEAERPILFTCVDKSDYLYICACHCANGEKCEWLVAHTDPIEMIELLTDKREIRNMFPADKNIWVVTQRKDGTQVRLSKDRKALETILPTEGYYMDVEPDEFTDELMILRHRLDEWTTVEDEPQIISCSMPINVEYVLKRTQAVYPKFRNIANRRKFCSQLSVY